MKGGAVVRINEITSAEDQLELWRLISNSVWQTIQQQQQEEQKRKAQAQAQLKRKPLPKVKRTSQKIQLPPSPAKSGGQQPTVLLAPGTGTPSPQATQGRPALGSHQSPAQRSSIPRQASTSKISTQNQEFLDQPKSAINRRASDRQA